jgi:hypothetical protein
MQIPSYEESRRDLISDEIRIYFFPFGTYPLTAPESKLSHPPYQRNDDFAYACDYSWQSLSRQGSRRKCNRKIDDKSRVEIKFAENKILLPWIVLRDDCDISVVSQKIVFRHLNGTGVTCDKYDQIHHSLRLCRKRRWTMTEVDAALRVFVIPTTQPTTVVYQQ